MAHNVNQRQFLALKLEAMSEAELGEVLDYVSAPNRSLHHSVGPKRRLR